MLKIDGKVAVITGANTGIGRETAISLAKQGATVVINYVVGEELAEEVKKEIESFGGKAIVKYCDVTSFEDTKVMMDEIKKELGSLDILVNNAGITRDTLLLRMKEEDFDKVIDVNLKGAFNCVKHASKIMMKQRSGRIINISSVVGLMGNVGQCNYSASKAGLLGITKSAARELAPRGITVNAVAPGFIESKMTEVLSDDIKEAMLSNIPLKSFGKAKDIANAVTFLASNEAHYITGQVISVDGGMYM
ncbi:3-oxoacyl-[acyl-carrier-protein] reductase [Vallitalea okinawensis]|uniref:3-oxoacyl-[acyl-carrier-protein] reductase n=1 Tax=Vallitalea okinawensis TaxID=2078660 RepID=UPI000CFAEA56|nr:3-oxoacyl-[acyl-carrier-protein] reductase [Vallitalea okinawensis]